METTVELYTPPITGTALDPSRKDRVDREIDAMEARERKKYASVLGLTAVATACETRITECRLSTEIDFPLLTPDEQRVWRAFLPMTYTTDEQRTNGMVSWIGLRPMSVYAFDAPPVSVLELWSTLQSDKRFDVYEIWTPERPMPEPILLGYKETIGPFLIARWGEALQPFEEIKKTVESRQGPQGGMASGTVTLGGLSGGTFLLPSPLQQFQAWPITTP